MPGSCIDTETQLKRLDKVKAIAGPRYDTRVNLELPISFNFDVLTKTETFRKKLLSLSTDIWKESQFIGRGEARKAAPDQYEELVGLLKSVTLHLKSIRESNATHRPRWSVLYNKYRHITELIWSIIDELHKLESKDNPKLDKEAIDRIKSEINELYRLRGKVDDLAGFTGSPAVSAMSKGRLLITGQAGAGKTHLLCDVASNRIKDQLPTYIFLGEEFTVGDPLARMAQLLTGDKNKLSVLKRINSSAKKKDKIALILIDAANEASGKVNWSKLNELGKFKNIAVSVSIRTGFEKAVLPSAYKKSFIIVDHEGFGDLDWQAVTNFFRLFNIPLPKVPIIAPEFRNPLFLKLFCQTYKRSGDFKGHLGTTKLFEAYNKKQGSDLLEALGLSANPTRIWKKIIKPMAQWMAENSQDRILEAKLRSIIESEFPGRSRDVLKLLQRYWLLTKVPHYTRTGTVRGYEYRFPYQKSSDHLIARCLLTTYLPKQCTNPKDFFSEDSKLGQLVSNSWNYGLVEALSIQVPERLKGVDLVSVVPEEVSTRDPLVKGFLQSLIWRDLAIKNGKHKCFEKGEALKYINNNLIPYENERAEFLGVVLSVSGMPDHPFNSLTLDKFLRQFKMGDRDSFWQSFVHYSYEDGAIMNRLIDWAWFKESKSYISDEALKLVSITLIWFLATTDRTVRDRSTKALVELLKGREQVLIQLLKMYEDVNDPYIKQRLFAVAYGCSLRASSDTSLKKLAMYIYKHTFKSGKPYPDILLRDYARNIIQLYCDHHPRSRMFNPELYKPPYNSSFPKRVPSLKVLQNKYRDSDDVKKDYSSIWMSVMYDQGVALGDFGNYTVNSNLNHFTDYRLGQKRSKTEQELLEEFKSKLNKNDRKSWEKIKDSWVLRPISLYFISEKQDEGDEDTKKLSEHEQNLKLLIKKFKTSVLSKKKYAPYRTIVSKHLSDARLKSYERFNTSRAQRWVFDRAIKLGWDPKQHGQFDRTISRSPIASRDRNNTERIGKKYQWIALYELLAMVSDNFYMNEEYTDGKLKEYSGTWELSIRDIDPTHTIRKTGTTDPEPNSWWVGASYSRWSEMPSPNDWLKDASDMPSLGSLLKVEDPNGQKWLNLKSYYTWKEPLTNVEESRRYDVRHKQFWIHVYGYLINKRDRLTFYRWAVKQDFWNKWMPESHEFYEIYYGEFPYSDAFRDLDSSYYARGWSKPTNSREGGDKCPVGIMVANDEYGQEGNTRDMSVDDGFMIQTPSSHLYKSMDLRLSSDAGEYRNDKDQTVFLDPTVKEDGPQSLLAREDLLKDYLASNDLTVVWTMIGEKQLIGGHDYRNYPKRLRFNAVYTLPNDRPYGRHSTILE